MHIARLEKTLLLAASVGLAAISLFAQPAAALSTITVAITTDFASRNPYTDSTAQMYGIWCQVYGCLGSYDPSIGNEKPMLAESWAIDPDDHNVWIIHLRQGLKRHGDGRE